MTPEGRVKREIKNWLKGSDRIYSFMPVQTGYGAASIDFLVCMSGRFIGIETKRKGLTEPSPRQRLVMDAIEAAGGWAFCCDSLDSFLTQYLERRKK
jgi:hypothetical protein